MSGDGMTLDQIIAWAEDAKKDGAPGDARPTAWLTGLSRRIGALEVDA